MGHLLQLEVPEAVYETIMRSAEQTGQEPEDVAVRLLVSAAENLVEDPLEAFIGAFPSDIADWGDHHDRYLGASLLEQGDAVGGDVRHNG